MMGGTQEDAMALYHAMGEPQHQHRHLNGVTCSTHVPELLPFANTKRRHMRRENLQENTVL